MRDNTKLLWWFHVFWCLDNCSAEPNVDWLTTLVINFECLMVCDWHQVELSFLSTLSFSMRKISMVSIRMHIALNRAQSHQPFDWWNALNTSIDSTATSRPSMIGKHCQTWLFDLSVEMIGCFTSVDRLILIQFDSLFRIESIDEASFEIEECMYEIEWFYNKLIRLMMRWKHWIRLSKRVFITHHLY